jgi:fatty-acyl-CoA synthase
MPGYKMEIRDENGEPLDDRQIGGVFIQGPSLMSGYHQNEKATDECMDGDGWLDTGDMGYVVEGTLYITGRRKDMIIISGRNIWPQDLEWHAEQQVEALRSRDTAAFGALGPDDKEEAVILVQCRMVEEVAREQLKKETRAAILKNTGVDCRVELIPQRSLPFTTSGKLRRAKAKRSWLAGDYDSI